MTLQDMAQDDFDSLYLNTDDWAEEVTLIDPHGAKSTPNAVVDWGQNDYGPDDDGYSLKTRARVLLSHTDLSEPTRRHRIVAVAPDGDEVTLGIRRWQHVEGGVLCICGALEDRTITGDGAETSRL